MATNWPILIQTSPAGHWKKSHAAQNSSLLFFVLSPCTTFKLISPGVMKLMWGSRLEIEPRQFESPCSISENRTFYWCIIMESLTLQAIETSRGKRRALRLGVIYLRFHLAFAGARHRESIKMSAFRESFLTVHRLHFSLVLLFFCEARRKSTQNAPCGHMQMGLARWIWFTQLWLRRCSGTASSCRLLFDRQSFQPSRRVGKGGPWLGWKVP